MKVFLKIPGLTPLDCFYGNTQKIKYMSGDSATSCSFKRTDVNEKTDANNTIK